MRPLRPQGKAKRNVRLRLPALTASAGEPSGIDKFLQRLANFSQPALLALGVFGYFYTVVPVFQNQQLQEQTAKLELEKSAAERQLTSLVAQQGKVKEEIERLQKEWNKERSRNSKLADDVTIALERETAAQRQSAEVEAKLQDQLRVLETARWELAILDFSSAYFFPRINSAIRAYNSDGDKQAGGFILAAGKEWPRPFEELLSAVDAAEKKGGGRNDIPPSYYSELRGLIKSNEQALQCNKADFAGMHAKYTQDIEALGSVIDTELESYVDKLRGEYAAKNQRVEITEEFRASSKRSIRIGKVYSVDSAYREKLSALRGECDKKGERILADIRKAKGATR